MVGPLLHRLIVPLTVVRSVHGHASDSRFDLTLRMLKIELINNNHKLSLVWGVHRWSRNLKTILLSLGFEPPSSEIDRTIRYSLHYCYNTFLIYRVVSHRKA